jgi:hypothetical protein
LAFLVTQFFQPVLAAVGHDWTFWIFATCVVVVLAFSVFFVPETKGKTLEEIQRMFRKSREDEDSLIRDSTISQNVYEQDVVIH